MSNKSFNLISYTLFFLYFIIACYKLESPGLHYDELLFVNAAQQTKFYNAFIRESFGNIPVLLMTYIGALKSYIYYPIINLFGINFWTLRLPVILITAMSLLFITKLTSKIFNKEFAVVTLILLAFNPTIIYMTRLDVGPNAIELFLKSLSCLVFFKYFFEKGRQKYLLAGILLLALGLFNKLNFIWFINALYATFFIFQFGHIRKSIIERDINKLKPYFALILSYFIYATYAFLIIKNYNLVDVNNSITLMNTFPKKINEMVGVLDGTTYLTYIYTGKTVPTKINAIIYLYGLLTFFALAISISKTKNEFISKYKTIHFAILLMIILHAIQILLTKEATSSWHAFTIFPFFSLLLAYSIYSACNILFKKKLKYVKISTIVLVATITIYQTITVISYFKVLGTKTQNVAWSNQIYNLIKYTKNKNTTFVILDWGIHNQLIAFDNKKDKYYEYFPTLTQGSEYEKDFLIGPFLRDSTTIFITHGKRQLDLNALENFKIFAKKSNKELKVVKKFTDSNEEVFVLYSTREASQPAK